MLRIGYSELVFTIGVNLYGDNELIEKMKQQLNSVSKSFCLAKWKHLTLHLATGHNHSCYLPQTHKVPIEEVKDNPTALHNSKYKKDMRKMMLKGERPKECSICWNVEDMPGDHYSDRHYRGVDEWTMPYFDKIKKLNGDENINPSYLEVSFGNTCNFKCSYCSPPFSNQWMNEIKKHGGYPLTTYTYHDMENYKKTEKIPLEEENNPYLEAFFKWWPDLVKELQFFRITGGEPLLSPSTFKVLDWLIEEPSPKLHLSVNSNLGVPEASFNRYMKAVKNLLEYRKIETSQMHTSIDTWGKQAEYIRHGLDLSVFENYLHRYLEELPQGGLAFMCTFNALSVVGFQEFMEKILELRQKYNRKKRKIYLDIPHLQMPHHQNVRILTPDYQDYMESHIKFMEENKDEEKGFKDAEIQKMKRILQWMREEMDYEKKRNFQANFYLFFKRHDSLRGTNFLEAFPQMEEFWNLCREMEEDRP